MFGAYDAVIWVDARIRLLEDPISIIETQLANADLASFRHPRNDTLSDELAEIREARLIPRRELNAFAQTLDSEDIALGPVTETGMMIVRPTAANRSFFAAWWSRIEAAPPRDQLTFDLARAEAPVSFSHIGEGQVDASSWAAVSKGEHQKSRPRRAIDERERLSYPLIWPANEQRHEQPTDRLGSDSCSVVIPVHDGLDSLRACVESVLAAGDDSVPVVLVDNGSSAKTTQFCSSVAARHSHVRHDHHDEPLGFGGASNRGVSICDSTFTFLLNSDVVLPSGWLKRLRSTPAANDLLAVGFVSNEGGDHSVSRGSHVWDQTDVDELRELVDIAAEFCHAWHGGGAIEWTRSVHGAAMLLRNDRFAELGGFDVAAFPVGYGEEVDLCLRAAAAGFQCGVDPSQFYYHRRGASFGRRRAELNEAAKGVLASRYPERVLRTISDDLRMAPSIAALSSDLRTFLEQWAR
jgi:GT2 family glycosyltransferase